MATSSSLQQFKEMGESLGLAGSELLAKTAQLNDQDFIIRSIYKDLY